VDSLWVKIDKGREVKLIAEFRSADDVGRRSSRTTRFDRSKDSSNDHAARTLPHKSASGSKPVHLSSPFPTVHQSVIAGFDTEEQSTFKMFGTDQSHKYRLKVTAGTDYHPSTHKIVPVNRDQTLRIENDLATVSLCVRIQNYTGESAPSHHNTLAKKAKLTIGKTRLPRRLAPNTPLLLAPPTPKRPILHLLRHRLQETGEWQRPDLRQ
jgi:hypothetical protein